MLELLHFAAKLSVLCLMLIGVVLNLNGTAWVACVSAVCILCGLYTVKWQTASSPVSAVCILYELYTVKWHSASSPVSAVCILYGLYTVNPSAWGHLNPSSYCDVGRPFYGVFKLWTKLQRKNE